MTSHLDTSTIYRLLDGELDAAAEGSAAAHLLRCDRCRAEREECRATLEALESYGAEAAPPGEYWDAFWVRFEERIGVAPVAGRRSERVVAFRGARLGPALATAAAIALLLLGSWWVRGPDPGAVVSTEPRTVAARSVVADTGWESDLEFFERATVAVGSVDPVSKGVALASMAESP